MYSNFLRILLLSPTHIVTMCIFSHILQHWKQPRGLVRFRCGAAVTTAQGKQLKRDPSAGPVSDVKFWKGRLY